MGDTPERSGPSWLTWAVVLLGLGGCTFAACEAAPHIGWFGWVVIAIVLFGWPGRRG